MRRVYFILLRRISDKTACYSGGDIAVEDKPVGKLRDEVLEFEHRVVLVVTVRGIVTVGLVRSNYDRP
ncbi:hypothetical protein GN958_ATG04195 [Phytophthora infestans]|uniref:Uncharacterized protein n=1 Tax=Phytophthora infestans TaxID=4787 RepID=A0A8S9V7U7_PHYIN|nr:hypothetical protein GN958_ATG04195 [Phytophthora infestans]